MLALVGFAQMYAITPISHYDVGAITLGETGALYYGANMEYAGAALSFTVHAEQSAFTNAWLNGEQGVASIAISAAPCGYCRQFLYEIVTAAEMTVVLPGEDPALLTSFLPQAFGPGDLGVTSALMTPEDHGLTLDPPPTDPAIQQALDAANASYAPYTSGFAGVALVTERGNTYQGRYAENAAFNPSMSPLESALTMWALAGDQTDAIDRVILVEQRSDADQASATAAVSQPLLGAEPEIHYT